MRSARLLTVHGLAGLLAWRERSGRCGLCCNEGGNSCPEQSKGYGSTEYLKHREQYTGQGWVGYRSKGGV